MVSQVCDTRGVQSKKRSGFFVWLLAWSPEGLAGGSIAVKYDVLGKQVKRDGQLV